MSPKHLEQLAGQLASRSDQAVRDAIQDYAPDERVALKLAITLARQGRGLTAQAEAAPVTPHPFEQHGPYWLRRLGVHGPLTLAALDAKLRSAHVPPEVAIAVKVEAEERHWLTGPVGYRVAAAAPALSLEMAQLYTVAGLDADGTYSPEALDDALAHTALTPQEKMAIRTECALRNQIHASVQETWHHKAQALRARLVRLRRLVHG